MKKLPLILSLLIFSQFVQASVYKCIGEDGKTRYQATACVGVILPIDESQPLPPPKPPGKQPSPLVPRFGENRHTVRSAAKKNLFKSIQPCPSNGEASGPCPGYVVDHITPLACGGADDPGNMQWQTVAAGKAKDAWERVGCQQTYASRGGKRSSHKPRLPGLNDIGLILLRMP